MNKLLTLTALLLIFSSCSGSEWEIISDSENQQKDIVSSLDSQTEPLAETIEQTAPTKLTPDDVIVSEWVS